MAKNHQYISFRILASQHHLATMLGYDGKNRLQIWQENLLVA
jgi:hypothetical protein